MAVSATTGAFANFSDDTAVVAVPAGAAAGDLFVLAVQYQAETATTVTWPSGFTEVAVHVDDPYIGSTLRAAIRVADGTEAGNFSTHFSSYQGWVAGCALVKGYQLPVEASSAQTTSGYGTSLAMTGSSVTTTGANRLVLWLGAAGNSGANPVVTQPSGLTLHQFTDSGGGFNLSIASGIKASAGAQAYSGSMACDEVGWSVNVITLALAPSAPPAGAELAGGAAAVASGTGALTTKIQLSGSAVASASGTGTLTTRIQLAGAAVAVATATGKLAGSAGGTVSQSPFAKPFTSGPWGTGPWLTSP